MRNLIRHLRDEHATRARLAESLHLLPHSELQPLFAGMIREEFDSHLQVFFSRLYSGIMKMMRETISKRFTMLEEAVHDMKRSMLMSTLHPYAWVEYEMVREAMEFIASQPGQKATIHDIYLYLAYDAGIPIAGAGQVEKYEFIIRILRKVPELREWEHFLFELVQSEVLEEADTLATSENYRDPVLLTSIRNMDARKTKVPKKVQGIPDDK